MSKKLLRSTDAGGPTWLSWRPGRWLAPDDPELAKNPQVTEEASSLPQTSAIAYDGNANAAREGILPATTKPKQAVDTEATSAAMAADLKAH